MCGPMESHGPLWSYGFYRQLNDGKKDFISFCAPEAVHWLSMYDEDFNALMDKWVPK